MSGGWFAIGAAALDRGYNFLTFDGPGQGAALRRQHLHYRPDWENVITPDVDYTLSRVDTDANAMVIFGWSMGGVWVDTWWHEALRRCIGLKSLSWMMVCTISGLHFELTSPPLSGGWLNKDTIRSTTGCSTVYNPFRRGFLGLYKMANGLSAWNLLQI